MNQINEALQMEWAFRSAPKDGGRDYGNANVWSFDPRIEVFVREVLQNALDAAVAPENQVRVTFKLIRLRGEDLAAFQLSVRWDELHSHLESSTDNRQKISTLIRDGLDSLDRSGEMLVLVVEDSGTTGLVGNESGGGKFAALCRNNLDSNKEGSTTKGGAFGLGKAVLWRTSRFATVLFCSDLSISCDGNQFGRLIGRCDLPWHCVERKQFAGPGWFGNLSRDGQAVSIWNDQALTSKLYLDRPQSLGSGTSIAILGFHDPSADSASSPRDLAHQIEAAAAEHFFPAIAAERLSVAVSTYEGRAEYDAHTPASAVEVDAAQFVPEYWKILQAHRDGSYADANGPPGDIVCRPVSLSISERKTAERHPECEHEALLILRYADEPPGSRANRVAMYRGPGMVVEEWSLAGLCLGARPFHALLLCGRAAGGSHSEEAEEFLRTAEPPSHNRWMSTAELKSTYKLGCVKKLDGFRDAIREVVRELVRPASRDLGDGPQALRELFRLGSEPTKIPRERPRVLEQSGCVDDQGRWEIDCRIRLRKNKFAVRVSPVVLFVAETGGGQAVRWESLEAVSGCEVDGHELIVPANRIEVRFRGRTSQSSHPVPARESSVGVDLRKVVRESKS